MFLRECDSALSQIEHDPGRHIVEVLESRLGRQGTSPRRVHREAGLDKSAGIHRGQPGGQRVGARG